MAETGVGFSSELSKLDHVIWQTPFLRISYPKLRRGIASRDFVLFRRGSHPTRRPTTQYLHPLSKQVCIIALLTVRTNAQSGIALSLVGHSVPERCIILHIKCFRSLALRVLRYHFSRTLSNNTQETSPAKSRSLLLDKLSLQPQSSLTSSGRGYIRYNTLLVQ